MIELLVVIAIIAMLLAIIVPSLSKAKKSARLVLCRNNLHQWAVAIETWAVEHGDSAPLTTTYAIDGAKVTAAYPNEINLDQHSGQLPVFGPANSPEAKRWQKMMISQEGIAPYLPGFNDKGMRTSDSGSPANFVNYPDNWVLDGVWKCPSQNRDREQDLQFILSTLTGQFGGSRSWFRVDYSYFGRTDLFQSSMIPDSRDRSSLVEKYPASGRVMLTDTIAKWGDVYWYNHGSEGPSYDNPVGDADERLAYTRPAELITGLNEAYGDGSVQWKRMGSSDRFRLDDNGKFDWVN
ncbi:MAG: type II secretion system protein, partial [Planctomycetes bacterium]|nr:type II secretion system protein [Planctomycetota bacterium]